MVHIRAGNKERKIYVLWTFFSYRSYYNSGNHLWSEKLNTKYKMADHDAGANCPD